MKLQTKKIVLVSDARRQVNPIFDIMTSDVRESVHLSEADLDVIRKLNQNPPPPTPELIEMLKQNLKSR